MVRKYSIYSLITGLFLSLFSFYTQAQELKKEANFSEYKFIPFYGFKKIGNTSIFQGNKKKKNYFEGWYFKMVSEDGNSILSVIPGISLSSDGSKKHAFIQVINGVSASTYYYSFPIEDFSFSTKELAIKIGSNYFSNDSIILDLKDNDTAISGKVKMHNRTNYASGRLLNPGIMGWYRYVPYMECYHGVVSLTHQLSGTLLVNDTQHIFNKGKGYLEKDWGSSMPSSWIWMQSNHFSQDNASFMLSIANIPWHGKSFNGFLGYLYYDNEIHQFATYRSSELTLDIAESEDLKINIKNRKHTFLIDVKPSHTGLLSAPVNGNMDRRIAESIDATIYLKMLNKEGETVYIDSTHIAGLETVGDYKALQGLLK